MSNLETETFNHESAASPESYTPEKWINPLLVEVGLNPETTASLLKERLALLGELTPTVEDERAAIIIAQATFDAAEAAGHPYTEDEQRTVKIGTLFTDVGKSGPREATPRQSEIIASMYSVENIPGEEVGGSISNFVNHHFPEVSEAICEELTLLGLDINSQTMRDFYDRHTQWTLDIIVDCGLPKEAIPAAAAHHHLRGDNPCINDENPGPILNERDEYTRDFGANAAYDRADKLVSTLDMYDALRRRSKLDHKAAMDQLHTCLTTTRGGYYKDDTELAEILTDIDAVMAAS